MVSKVVLVAAVAAVAAGAAVMAYRKRKRNGFGVSTEADTGHTAELVATTESGDAAGKPGWRKPIDKAAAVLRRNPGSAVSAAS